MIKVDQKDVSSSKKKIHNKGCRFLKISKVLRVRAQKQKIWKKTFFSQEWAIFSWDNFLRGC